MKTTLKIAAICAALTPAAAIAQDAIVPTEDELQAFRDAITSVGCTIADDATAASVETATGYTEALLEAIVAQLRIYDEIIDASEDGGITLVSGACAA